MDEPIRDYILEKPLPSSPQTERAILGSIMLDNDLIAQAAELLEEDDFYVPSHRRIFKAMITLFKKWEEINQVSISHQLTLTNELDASGGFPFLGELMYGIPQISSLEQYAKIVKGKSALRKLVKAANKITAEALEEEDEPEAIGEHACQLVFDTVVQQTSPGFSRFSILAHKDIQRVHEMKASGKHVVGISTGFSDVDSKIIGLEKKVFYLIAARPRVGKTSLALNMAENTGLAGAHVAVFSLEMSKEECARRILCSKARLDSQRYRMGYLSDDEWDRLHDAEHALAQAHIYIDDTPALSTLKMKAKIQRFVVEHGKVDLVIADYLQLMTTPGRQESRQQEVSQISRELKAMAKELDVPLVVLSQLNRDCENRTNHRPILSDLRESGSLEQDADVVGFLYREDLYKDPSDHEATLTNTAEFIIAKQRNGPPDTVLLHWDGPSTRFDNLHTHS